MRKTIRISCFETNSSSLHSLVVARGNRHIPDYMKKEPVEITGGEFGWDCETYGDPLNRLDYIYTALKVLSGGEYGHGPESEEELKYANILNQVKNALASVGVEVKWGSRDDKYCPVGYIDHVYNLQDFLDFLGKSDDNILDFIFDDNSAISTGNDNDTDDYPADISPTGVDYVEFEKGN